MKTIFIYIYIYIYPDHRRTSTQQAVPGCDGGTGLAGGVPDLFWAAIEVEGGQGCWFLGNHLTCNCRFCAELQNGRRRLHPTANRLHRPPPSIQQAAPHRAVDARSRPEELRQHFFWVADTYNVSELVACAYILNYLQLVPLVTLLSEQFHTLCISIIQTMERVTWFFLEYLICYTVASCLTMAAQTKLNITTDRSALLALKARITSDPQNMIFTNWSTSTPICNWVGVTCGARHHRIAELNLSYFGHTGTIPPELGNLPFLINMDFSNNSFHGILPHELARLRRLKFISLGNNKFMGVIPSCTKYIIYLILAGMCIDFSEIPNEIGTLNHLEKLYVQQNALKGPIPMTIFNMSSLTIVTFYGNNLNGRIPDNICQNLPNIQALNLGANQFNGPIPSIFGQCKQLLSLNLELNWLTGPIPYEIGYLPNLEILSLAQNNINGHIPSSIFNISTIKVLDLGLNHLSSSLPANIGLGLPNLQWFSVGGNHLSGVIPKSISNASEIRSLDLGENSFSGFIPSTLCLLTNLEWLTLAFNNLTIDASTREVNIFSCLPNLRNLRYLDFGSNPLNAELSISFSNFSASLFGRPCTAN
ncbi:putative non-specific serine/threonine protein kinase [Rosa chinensis]|uniref:Putative non-specific serine/threonine protein kinase n=1 Tax=Rosa chinensis TaxID=74649 RepID=A0A2P6RQN7_ROSCH|nr:putative non-specific serine/threonine protein kinase [Rosa chinensis]